jgi:[acyl-carrier-protein] S-malonyltransferase
MSRVNGHAQNNSGLLSRATALVFRGYNVTNLGRTRELLAHPAYGPAVEKFLREGSEICAATVKRPVDLVQRVRDGRDTHDLTHYAEDVALIVAVELAQISLLEQFFGVTMDRAKLVMGYSLGEASALIAARVFEMKELLRVPLALADDCAELARDVTMGVFFSRGPVLDLEIVKRMCLTISQRGHGTIDVSTYLSPNSILLMGQNNTMSQFEEMMGQFFSGQVYLRRNSYRWPPLHTAITWQKHIPNRSAVLMQSIAGGMQAPSTPVLSLVTGDFSYDEFNSREILHQWVDHPQRLWDGIYQVLSAGVEQVVHVGPAPNLVPATLRRLANNIHGQIDGRSWGSFGRRAVSKMVRRPWLTRLLPSFTVLFRALFVQQIILEDWLLEHQPN